MNHLPMSWRKIHAITACKVDPCRLVPCKAEAKDMSKERRNIKETRKQPAMTAKEKKAAKKAKKNERARIGA